MKKIFCLLAVICLMLSPVLALAVDYDNYGIYANEDGSCGFAYPDGWMVLSKENLDALWAQAQKMGDEEFQAIMENARPQMEELGMVMLMNETMESNISVIRQEMGMSITPEALLASVPMIQEQLAASLGNVQFAQEPSLVEIEAGQAMLIPYVYEMLDRQLMGVQAYVGVGTGLYTFTLTANPSDEDAFSVFGFVLGSALLQ